MLCQEISDEQVGRPLSCAALESDLSDGDIFKYLKNWRKERYQSTDG